MNNYAKNLVKNMKSFIHANHGHNGKLRFIANFIQQNRPTNTALPIKAVPYNLLIPPFSFASAFLCIEKIEQIC